MTTVVAAQLAPPGAVTACAAIAVSVLMLALWLLSIPLRDVSIVDPAWGPAFVLVALVSAIAGAGCMGRRWLLLGMTAVWGMRLGAYLLVRKLREPGEDRRYAAIRERRGAGFVLRSLVWIFGLQRLLVLIVSLPIQVAAGRGGALTAAVIPGVVLFLVGLAFEAIGDEQLRRFKACSDSHGQVMDQGLWRRPGYAEYVRRTSGFFPWPPKRGGGQGDC
ncbi:MAG: DUF1295 domain-containing protein [Solirubrobacteraceae bacterium]